MDDDAFERNGRKFKQSKGREGWLDLMINYNGYDESERRKTKVKQPIMQ